MRILLVNQSFYPDHVSVAQHAADLAASLSARGHLVTVVASRHAYDNPTVSFASREIWQGCVVRRVRGLGLGKRSKWRRMADSSALLVAFALELSRLPRFDLVIAMTHPPMIATVAALIKGFRGGRFVSWLMDLNPDEAIAAGWLPPNSVIARVLQRMLHFSLTASERIIVLDRFMQRRIESKGIAASRLMVMPPWSHDKQVAYDPAGREEFRREHSLSDKFVVMYSGNLSIVHPLDTVLQAAARLKDRTDIVFCFVGGGNAVPGARKFAEERGLRNLVFLPYQPLGRLGGSLSAADLHLVVMGDSMVGIVHPCKIYNVLSLGIPFLHLGPSENHIADLMRSIRTPGAAYHAAHGAVHDVIAAVTDAADKRLGSAKELKEKSFAYSQVALIPKLIEMIESIGAVTRLDPAVAIETEFVGESN